MRTSPLVLRALGSVLLMGTVAVLVSTPSTASAVAVHQERAAAPNSTPQVLPRSAVGCNGSICIQVVGSGLNVSSWSTTLSLTKSLCTTAYFLVNGTVKNSVPNFCGSAGEQLEAVWTKPGSFANGTSLCNTWKGITGEPCETVHS
jgi:hypothetical protein